MTLSDSGRRWPTNRPGDPPVTVRMEGDHVIIRTDGRLDRDATNALAETINGAITAACAVTLDLQRVDGTCPPLMNRPRRHGADRVLSSLTSASLVTAVRSGVLRVSTAAPPCLIDVKSGRVYIGDAATDWRFIPTNAWVPVTSITKS